MNQVKFDSLAKFQIPEDYDGVTELEVLPTDADLSNEKIEITHKLKLKFVQGQKYTCKILTFADCPELELIDLDFEGPIVFNNTTVTMTNCIVQYTSEDSNFVVAALDQSIITANNCQFPGSRNYSFYITSRSQFKMSHCSASKSGNIIAYINDAAALHAEDSSFFESKNQLIYCDTFAQLVMNNCKLYKTDNFAISSNSQSVVEAKNCEIYDIENGAISIYDSGSNVFNDCNIYDCRSTVISVYRGNFVAKDSIIQNAEGNIITASSGSHIELRFCKLYKSKWPSIVLLIGSDGIVEDTEFKDSEMGAIVLRGDSSIKAKNIDISGIKDVGIKISDGENISFENVNIDGCGIDAINISDHSIVSFEKCNIKNAKHHLFNISTGSSVIVNDATLTVPFESAFFVHAGGDVQVENSTFILDPVKPEIVTPNSWNGIPPYEILSSDGFKQMVENEQTSPNGRNVFRIETNRPVSVTRCWINGEPEGFNFMLNPEVLSCQWDPTSIVQPKCLLCGNSTGNTHFSPCGHSVYCMNCWNVLEAKPENCPICRTYITKNLTLFNESDDAGELCPICYELPIDCYLIPCGHTFCRKCCMRSFYRSKDCPFCREENVQVRRFITYG